MFNKKIKQMKSENKSIKLSSLDLARLFILFGQGRNFNKEADNEKMENLQEILRHFTNSGHAEYKINVIGISQEDKEDREEEEKFAKSLIKNL